MGRPALKRTEKKCSSCNNVFPISEYPTRGRNRDGSKRQYDWCKKCHSRYQRRLVLKTLFNMTPQDYEAILTLQGGVCALCKRPPKTVRLAVDHDHKTGLIRGLLCQWCNRAIGQFRDDIARVNALVKYFTDPPATIALGSPRFGAPGRVSNRAATRRKLIRERDNEAQRNQASVV